MSRITTFSVALASSLATLAPVFPGGPAMAEEKSTRLSLATDYLAQRVEFDTVSLGAHTISLKLPCFPEDCRPGPDHDTLGATSSTSESPIPT